MSDIRTAGGEPVAEALPVWEREDALGRVALAHIAYWTFGAVWPLIDIKSFEKVTGHKREDWLVRSVALLMLSVVVSLETMREHRRDDVAMRVLGAASAAALGGVALVGPLVGRISPVYLTDALVDLGLAIGWLRARSSRRA